MRGRSKRKIQDPSSVSSGGEERVGHAKKDTGSRRNQARQKGHADNSLATVLVLASWRGGERGEKTTGATCSELDIPCRSSVALTNHVRLACFEEETSVAANRYRKRS
ncbi:hypothetical protein KM043_016562 [Ampulex compressa]|nr:hypothetical protein KM043_016562 [Ampulex compressa]